MELVVDVTEIQVDNLDAEGLGGKSNAPATVARQFERRRYGRLGIGLRAGGEIPIDLGLSGKGTFDIAIPTVDTWGTSSGRLTFATPVSGNMLMWFLWGVCGRDGGSNNKVARAEVEGKEGQQDREPIVTYRQATHAVDGRMVGEPGVSNKNRFVAS